MDYLYNKKNILEFPEKYMYTKFYGYSFIDSFSKDRKELINSLKIKRSEFFIKDEKVFHLFSLVKKNIFFPSDLEKKIIACYKNNENKNNKSNFDMQKFSIEKDLRIQELLNSLFFSIKSKKNILKNKLFLEHLVQRFEVTKKIYKNYLPGFRKGINGCDDLNIYWIFSAILSIYYFETKNIKYLNTLLKVTDLLSSQPLNKLIEMLPNYGLEVVLICENEFIQNLINSTEKNS